MICAVFFRFLFITVIISLLLLVIITPHRTPSDSYGRNDFLNTVASKDQNEEQRQPDPVVSDVKNEILDKDPIVKVDQEVSGITEQQPRTPPEVPPSPSSSSSLDPPTDVPLIPSNAAAEEEKEVTAVISTVETLRDAAAPPEEPGQSPDTRVESGSVPASENADAVLEVTPTVSNATDPDSPVNTTEKDIPSFREWAQKALEEEQKKLEEEKRKKEEEKEKKKLQQQQMQNIKSTENNLTAAEPVQETGKPLKKNFASIDCGAKVIGANPEAQGAGNMILPSRDEYMLNKCTDKVWFVVELCESIKALKIEFANFELYSSVPRRIRVTLGNAYPARDKDWALFGEFDAEEDRSVQIFTAADGGVFGKYAKVEILSHYGTEHYCPVSLFRIYGVSEIEMIGADDDDDDDIADGGSAEIGESPATTTTTQSIPNPGKTIVSLIKEKIDQTLQKVVGVFRPKDQNSNVDMLAALNASSLVGNSLKHSVICPGCEVERQREVFFLLASNYKLLMRALDNYSLRRSLENGVCQSLGFDFRRGELVCYSSQAREFYETLFGTSGTIALCNAIAVELHAPPPLAVNQTFWTTAVTTTTATSAEIFNSTDKVASTENGTATETLQESDAAAAATATTAVSGATVVNGVHNGQTVESHSPATEEKQIMTNVDIKSVAKEELARQDPNGRSEDSSSSSKIPEGEQSNDIAKVVDVPHPGTAESPFLSTPPPPPQAESLTNSNNNNGDGGLKKPKEDEMKELPPVVHVTPSSASHISPSSTSQSSSAQRESVWQKLSNKIKSLERNVTLSGGYLEELSVRYKKQIEDLQLSVRQVSEALGATLVSREEDRKEIDRLRTDLKIVSEGVEDMVSKLEAVGTWAIGLHIFFLLVEIIVGFLFLFSCCPRARSRHRSSRSRHQEVQLGHREENHVTPSRSATHLVRSPLAVRSNLEELLEIPSSKTATDKIVSLKSLMAQKKDGACNNSNNSKGSSTSSNSLLLSRRQRKRMLRKMNKVSSLGRLEDLYGSSPRSVYHTFHSEDDFKPVISRRKMSYPLLHSERWRQDSEDTGSENSDLLQRSRFQIQPVQNSVPKSTGGPRNQNRNRHNNHQPLAVNNKFGLLNSSQHDDDNPRTKKGSSVVLNGHRSVAETYNAEERGRGGSRKGSGSGGRSKQQRLTTTATTTTQQQLRSKSTSPQRMGETALTKQRVLFKNFNPDNAEWIKK